MQSSIEPKAAAPGLSLPRRVVSGLSPDVPGKAKFLLVICSVLAIAIAFNYLVAFWIKLPNHNPIYRRIGPETGPQVFCAGSSLLQFGLSWPEVSKTLDQGIESWGLAASTPSEWEVFQNLAKNTDLMIIGVDVYDLNEYHLCEGRADVVPVTQTIWDLWQSSTGWQFSKRLLSQYPLSYLQKLFPTAGSSEAVLVGLRRLLPERLRSSSAAEERANSLVLPRESVMDFGATNAKVSDWTPSRTLWRLAQMRSETHGKHAFNGVKKLAFERMLLRARKQGSVIVVVLPVSPLYAHEFLTPEAVRDFESVLDEAQHIDPQAQFVRLDKLPALNSDECFGDLVHLNDAGKRIATDAFLSWLREHTAVR
ncbi:MAG TPA: hypothetical protein VFH87_12750 [Candidatus Udaeobacter sp.]|nr:hypothetical protein [Candidatus Udaeobacter sp.]